MAKLLLKLENSVFNSCNIVNPQQNKGLLLMYAGSDLNDIVDSFDQNLPEPIAAVEAQDNRPAISQHRTCTNN